MFSSPPYCVNILLINAFHYSLIAWCPIYDFLTIELAFLAALSHFYFFAYLAFAFEKALQTSQICSFTSWLGCLSLLFANKVWTILYF